MVDSRYRATCCCWRAVPPGSNLVAHSLQLQGRGQQRDGVPGWLGGCEPEAQTAECLGTNSWSLGKTWTPVRAASTYTPVGCRRWPHGVVAVAVAVVIVRGHGGLGKALCFSNAPACTAQASSALPRLHDRDQRLRLQPAKANKATPRPRDRPPKRPRRTAICATHHDTSCPLGPFTTPAAPTPALRLPFIQLLSVQGQARVLHHPSRPTNKMGPPCRLSPFRN